MKSKLFKPILLFVPIFFSNLLMGQNSGIKVYKKCLPAIVKITIKHNDGVVSKGTGFFIDEKTIVTCYHVVENPNSIKIETSDGRVFTPDSVISSNKKLDLFKFTVKEKNRKWLNLASKNSKTGESIFIIGNPSDCDFSISNGIVSAVRIENSRQTIQTNAPTSTGNSGGPMLNKNGEVIGVMAYVIYSGQNLNFAVSSNEILKMTDDNTIENLTATINQMNKEKIDSLIKLSNTYYSKKEYDLALTTLLPITQFTDSTQVVSFLQIIGDCHFYKLNYAKAEMYYKEIVKKFSNEKTIKSNDLDIYMEALYKYATCQYILDSKKYAIQILSKHIEICKSGIENDILKKEYYTKFLQLGYILDAMCKAALKNTSEACISWRLAKEYGYEKDDYGFDALCK